MATGRRRGSGADADKSARSSTGKQAPAGKTPARKSPAGKTPAAKTTGQSSTRAGTPAAKTGTASKAAPARRPTAAAQRAPVRPARPLGSNRAAGAAGASYPKLVAAVAAAAAAHNRISEPIERTRALGELMDALLDELSWVTADRDQALVEVLESPHRPSNRALAQQLGIAHQRADQLVRHVRAGGRPQRP